MTRLRLLDKNSLTAATASAAFLPADAVTPQGSAQLSLLRGCSLRHFCVAPASSILTDQLPNLLTFSFPTPILSFLVVCYRFVA